MNEQKNRQDNTQLPRGAADPVLDVVVASLREEVQASGLAVPFSQWVQHCRDRGRPLSESQQRAQFAECEGLTRRDVAGAVNRAIASNHPAFYTDRIKRNGYRNKGSEFTEPDYASLISRVGLTQPGEG